MRSFWELNYFNLYLWICNIICNHGICLVIREWIDAILIEAWHIYKFVRIVFGIFDLDMSRGEIVVLDLLVLEKYILWITLKSATIRRLLSYFDLSFFNWFLSIYCFFKHFLYNSLFDLFCNFWLMLFSRWIWFYSIGEQSLVLCWLGIMV